MATTAAAPKSAPAPASLEGWWTRLVEVDFTRPGTFALLAIVYIASRAPFLAIGYGTDPDAWRIALSGLWLWDHGEFYPSRLPGYPLPELASALVIKGGPVATNGLTMLVSLGGVWFFAGIVKRLELPSPALVVVGFAFTPLLWINSMTTMDYMWALTFILGAYYFLLGGQAWVAGLMLGLAVASRSTSALMLAPMVLYLWRDQRRGEIRPFVVTVVFIALIAWLPIYWKYDLSFLKFYDAKVGHLVVARLFAKDTLGILGALGVLAAAAISLPRLMRLPRDVLHDNDVMLWVLSISLIMFSFLRLPHEAAYLIALYPFAFFIMARYFRPAALTLAVSAILLTGVFDLTAPGEEISAGELAELRPGKGLILSNRDTMLAQIDYTRDLEDLEFEGSTVVSTGFVYPILAVRNYDEWDVSILRKDRDAISQLSDAGQTIDLSAGSAGPVIYVWLLEWDDFAEFRERGFNFAFTQDAGRSQGALYEYRMGLFGGEEIDLGRSPTGGSGTARTDR